MILPELLVAEPEQQAQPLPELLALGPRELRNYRRERYVGDDLHVNASTLMTNDGEALRVIYASLNELLDGFTDPDRPDAARWEHIRRWCQRPEHGLDTVFTSIQQFGLTTLTRDGYGEMLAKVLHDVRGGALTALLGRLQLLERLPRDEPALRMIFVLARDHLKIMRSAFTGLDDRRREADRTPKSHAMHLILEKWHDSVLGPYAPKDGHAVRMFVDSLYDGALTECCLESAAIDRIFYNLAANACRHCTPGGRLEMSVFPLPDDPENLRFVLFNPVALEEVATLRALGDPARSGHEPGGVYLDRLFSPTVSSTGSGYGLAVVADFVAGAYGLADAEEAVADHYVGALLDGDTFRVFFHWPAARNDFPQKLDDPHRPQESLSE